MAKMHEAIYDLLPEEQTQVSVTFEIHVTPLLQMHEHSVTRETAALSARGGILSFGKTYTQPLLGILVSHTAHRGWVSDVSNVLCS